MRRNHLQRTVALFTSLLIFTALAVHAQSSGSTRPRRVNRQTARTDNTSTTTDKSSSGLLDVEPANANANNSNNRRRNSAQQSTNSDAPLLTPIASTPVGAPVTNNSAGTSAGASSGASADTTHAFSLLKAKQYDAALKEARQITGNNPNDSEGWKIAGFAELNLKQYEAASADLQKAYDLQRTAKQEDPFTSDALAHAYYLSGKFDLALPLLTKATSRKEPKPDAVTIFRRGVAEYKTGKTADAERTFNSIVKDNPKDAEALFFLGQIAFDRNDLDAAIAALNRATQSDARSVFSWDLLTRAYLQRAAAAKTPAQADEDYLSAVRAGEGLTRVQTDVQANVLFAQALFDAKQYTRVVTILERFVANPDASPSALFLYGASQATVNNFPKAISTLERAASKTPDNVYIYSYLGFAYESMKQYPKALAAYQKGASLAPNDAGLKEAIERVRAQIK